MHAIAELAQAEQSDIVATAYGINNLSFGPEYLIPKPFDPRLMMQDRAGRGQGGRWIPAWPTRPIADMQAYAEQPAAIRLPQRHLHEADVPDRQEGAGRARSASCSPKAKKSACCARCRSWSTKTWPSPILVGRPAVLEQRIEKFGLRLKPGVDFDVINPEFDERYRDYWQTYLPDDDAARASPQQYAKLEMRRRHTLIGAMMIHKGDADGMICGTYRHHRPAPALHRPGARQARRRQRLRGDELR